MDRGAWWATVHGITKSWTWLSNFHFTFLYCQSLYPFGLKTFYSSVVILEEFWKRAELPVLFSWYLNSLSLVTFSIQSRTPEPLAFQSCITCGPSLCCSLLQAHSKSREPVKMQLAGSLPSLQSWLPSPLTVIEKVRISFLT